MPKVLPAIFSYEDMKSRWNQDNPDEPYGRNDNLQNGIYAIDNWLIRVDDEDNAIATGGWKEYPTHTVVGGLYAVKRADRNHPDHDPKLRGNARAIQDAREPQLNQSKPIIASFAQQRGDNSRWIATAKKTQKFVFSDDPEWEQAISVLPKEVVKEWTEKSGNRWGIRNILTTDELAKCIYPDDPMPTWFNLLKSEKRGWREIIKVLPPSPPFESYPNYPEADNSHVDFPPQIHTIGDMAVIVRGHYLMRVNGTLHGTRDTNTDEILKWLECVKDLPAGQYYMYRNANPKDYQTILIDIIVTGMKFPNSAPEKFLGEGLKNPETGETVTKVIIFTNYFNRSKDKPKGRKFVPCNGAKEEKKHPAQIKREKIKERQEFNPFDPVQAAAKRKKLAEENRRRGNRRYRR